MKKTMILTVLAALSMTVHADTAAQLEKTFDNAVKSGLPLTADRAFTELVDKGAKLSPARYLQAAEVSRQLGRDADRRTRLSHYLKVEKSRNDDFAAAAYYLAFVSKDADALAVAVGLKPQPPRVISLAIGVLDQYVKEKRAADLKKVATAMLAAYDGAEDRNSIYRCVADMVLSGAPGFSVDEARELIERYPTKDCRSISRLVNSRKDNFSSIWCLRYMAKNGGVLEHDAFAYAVSASGTKDSALRAEIAKLVAPIRPLVLDGKHHAQAGFWLKFKLSMRDVLAANGREAQFSAEIAADFDALFAAYKDRDDVIRNFANVVFVDNQGAVTKDTAVAMRRKYAKYMRADKFPAALGLAEECEKARSLKPLQDVVASLSTNPTLAGDIRYWMLPCIAKLGDVSEIRKVLAQRLFYCGRQDGVQAFDYGYVLRNMGECKQLNDKVLADMFSKLYALRGAHPFWNWLVNDGWAKRQPVIAGEAVQAFLKKVDKSAKSSERMVEIYREMSALSNNQKGWLEKAQALFAEACKLYPGKYPNFSYAYNSAFGEMLWKLRSLGAGNTTTAPVVAKAIADALDPKSKYDWKALFDDGGLWWNMRDKPDVVREISIARAKALEDVGYARDAIYPEGTDSLPFDKALLAKNPGAVVAMVARNWDNWNAKNSRFTPRLAGELLSLALPLVNYDDPGASEWINNTCFGFFDSIGGADPKALEKFPYDAIAAKVLDGKPVHDRFAAKFISISPAAKRAAYLDRFVKAIANREPYDRANLLFGICGWDRLTPTPPKGSKDANVLVSFAKDALVPALKSVPAKYAPFVSFGENGEAWQRLARWSYDNGNAAKDALADLSRECVRLMDGGASGFWREWGAWGGGCYLNAYSQALSASNAVAMASIARSTGARMRARVHGWPSVSAVLDKTLAQERWEPLYLLASSCPDDDRGVVALVAKCRAAASQHLTGVYPVSERDPLYPLYVAADEYSKNNIEKATSLLMKNLTTFERDAIKLPPAFTAWAVDQMRLARGDKDELLVKARTLASRLLEDESRLPAELAAALLLVRAECYRDQQNFEVAKLEYQTIRNSPVYSKTKSGRKAMFRSIDLMIDTGNASGTESTLEYWLSQPDPEVQAQAHYFLARIAFDRKDYEECRKQLKEVFSIDFTHTEGRFLEGRWKLATGNEVDDTDVMIGSLSDRTMIRPGQQLAITVQDRNLSVAGGGASIPVVVTTKPGGDSERIYLYPTPRDPTLFRGVIDVKLGEVAVSNLTLEVTGEDTATYMIEPEYLKARGLPSTVSKVLRVVDDGRLAIGAGSPRTEEGETQKALEAMVDSGVESREVSHSLRPGNPLYVAVMDKDRSSKGGGEVTVSISTTSGDRLDSVKLKEVRPYSGIFRGEVPTSLPPPRAHASDTAIGYNPGDVISLKRDGGWRSLADGKPGKWIEVDTMASHEFSNIVFKTANPEALRSIRLSGRLSGTEITLGSFPAQPAKGRIGLRRWMEWRGNLRTEQAIRDFISSPQAPKPMVVTNAAVVASARNNQPCVAYLRGGFKLPQGIGELRLKIVPKNTGGDTFRRLWLSVNVDGQEVYSGYGATIANSIVTCELSPKCHLLEVFCVAYGAADSFEICWDPADGETVPLPQAWFDDTANPDLIDFLADKVSVVRVPEGFSATFREPIRLRSFRLDVVDRVGPDAGIDKITATDWSGNRILPVESDFSEVQRNNQLEVAPGDRISATYADDVTTSGRPRVLTKTVGSSFNNAAVSFYFEDIYVTTSGSNSKLNTAYRFVPGDTLLVGVYDPDQDLTDEADKVKVKVSSTSGVEREITLTEQSKWYAGVPWNTPQDVAGVHSGFFLGLLKTTAAGATNSAARAAFPVTVSDSLTASYEDRENTSPGIPFVRTAKVVAARETKPVFTLYQTQVKRVVDTSRNAEIKLAALRRRAGNEKVDKLYRDVYIATPMPQEACDSTNPIPVNAAAPLPIRVVEPSRARHRDSYLVLSAVADSELKRAEADGDEPQVKRMHLKLGGGFDVYGTRVDVVRGGQSIAEAHKAGSFNGAMRFVVGGIDTKGDSEYRGNREKDVDPIVLPVNGSDMVTLTVTDSKGVELAKHRLRLVSDAALSLVDSSWTAERDSAHVGEKFYLRVDDADRDESDEPDLVEVDVKTTGGTVRKVVLTETLPHSGIFTGTVRPTIFVPGDEIPEVTTGAQASAEQLLLDDRIPVKFGERLAISYRDENVLPGTDPRTLSATGTVYKGADGSIRLFSKRFRDVDSAVLVQFRLAECLFEQAKDYRKLRQNEKSSEAIAAGRAILEEALKNNPESAHVAQGEFLLANLYQELAAEEDVQAKALRKEGDTEAAAESEKKSRQLYAEALARFSSILAVWPEGEYAPRAQYHKAYCLEMLKEYKLAGEEYVKMTYMYPESDLVGDATIRLATYYFKEEKKYETAARIYGSFARRFPNHDKAARALFMCGSCYIKEGERIVKQAEASEMKAAEKKGVAYRGIRTPQSAIENFTRAVNSFVEMVEKYSSTTTPELRAQGLYWAGDASMRKEDAKSAYIFLKRTVLEYPETEWARRARGLMLQNGKMFKDLD